MNTSVMRYLDLSTGHLTAETIKFPMYMVADYEYGCFVYVPPEIDADCQEDLKTVLEYAKRHACTLIRFDSDADAIASLPTYEW